MLKSRFELETAKEQVYQVLFLTNDSSKVVTVKEGKVIDFDIVEEHLKLGGAKFITGKSSHKTSLPEKDINEKSVKLLLRGLR